MATMIKKTLFSFDEFRNNSGKFENGTFHHTNEKKEDDGEKEEVISHEAFDALVKKLVDHEREEFAKDGEEEGITTEELDQMHAYIEHHAEEHKKKHKKVAEPAAEPKAPTQEMNEKAKNFGPIKSTGEYSDYSIAELEKMVSALMKKDKRTKAEQTKVRQINFAISAKKRWGKKKK